jgi:hypothetical protein
VPDLVAGGRVDVCGAVPGREVRSVGEAGDVADVDEQPSGAGGADAVQGHQRGAGRGGEFGELFVGGLLALVDPLKVGDQFRGHPAACLACCVAGSDLDQQRLGLGGGEVLFAPPGTSSRSSWCSWETIRVWSSPNERRRSTRICRTVSCSSSITGRRPLILVPTKATE